MTTERQIVRLIKKYIDFAKNDLDKKPIKCDTREMTLYLISELNLILNDIDRINKGELII